MRETKREVQRERGGVREREREVRGPHHRSPTQIPTTSTSLHYLHVNDSSLCPAEGRKRPINTTAEKSPGTVQPTQSGPPSLLHSPTHTHTNTLVRAHTQLASRSGGMDEDVGTAVGRLFPNTF